jgi:hypothetical protein
MNYAAPLDQYSQQEKDYRILQGQDQRLAMIYSAVGITVFMILTFFISFFVTPPIPADTPPLKSDEVIEEFMIDNVEVQTAAESGGMGGGEPIDARIDEPREQSEKFVTQNTPSSTKIFSGNSNAHNSPNNKTNGTSTTKKSDNPFGSGGHGGKGGAGYGGPFGNDKGSSGEGPGGKGGNGNGRKLVQKPVVPPLDIPSNIKMVFKVTVNDDGNVVSASFKSANPSTTDQSIISKVKNHILNGAKYNSDPGAGIFTTAITVNVVAQ